MNLTNQAPFQKAGKPEKDAAYLRKVRELPCCVCDAFGEFQLSQTTAHHPIHDRYGNEKTPDREAIPLCDGHHQGQFDTSKLAIHRGKQTWREKYGSDRNFIAATQDAILGGEI